MRVTCVRYTFDKTYLQRMRRRAQNVSPNPNPNPSNQFHPPPVNREFVGRKFPHAVAGELADFPWVKHRQRASALYTKRTELLAAAAQAHGAGRGALARELSGEARSIADQALQQSAVAAELVFKHHNPGWSLGHSPLVDLHGLYAREAVFYFSRHLQRCIARGETRVQCVVGRGQHSERQGPGAVLASAIVQLCRGLDVRVAFAEAGLLSVWADKPFDKDAVVLLGLL
jgi:hypothetical protein